MKTWIDYYRGETLRLAARALHRQVKKRFPDCPYPPRKGRPDNLPEYEAWLDKEVLPRYNDLAEADLTKAELAANDRWMNAVINASEALNLLKAAKKQKEIEEAGLDPYGHLTWGIGDEDDFVCLDWGTIGDGYYFQAVVNSEIGSFIMEFGYEPNIPAASAVRVAISLCDNAYSWCWDNEVEIDEPGWNYSAYRFVEDVKQAVGDTTTVNPFPRKPE